MALAPLSRLGSYEVVNLLGAGGMGEVYRAKDVRLGRDVAIKVLPVAFTADPDRLARFEQEARAAAALNHPNILAVHDIGQYQGAPFIVAELLEGQSLRETLQAGPLPVRKVVDYGVQIAQGLATAHEKGIVHRDLKPDNVCVFVPSPNTTLGYSVAPDGRFLFAQRLQADPPPTSIDVVLNWFSEITRAAASDGSR